MRRLKITGLILAGLLAISSTAFAHGGGGGGFGGHGGGGFGGGHFGGGHFGGGHFGGTHFAAGHFGGHDGFHGGNYGHYYWRGGHWYGGRWYGGGWYPYGLGLGLGYPYYDDYGYDAPDAYDGDESAYYDEGANSGTVVAAQRELAKLGYYHGSIDGVVGPETEKAVRWFQSVDKIPVTGQLDDQTLQALQVG
jgi:Putative peptidoglycan binding domain